MQIKGPDPAVWGEEHTLGLPEVREIDVSGISDTVTATVTRGPLSREESRALAIKAHTARHAEQQ